MLFLPLQIGVADLQRYVFDADLDVIGETATSTLVLPGISRQDLGGCPDLAVCLQGLRDLLDGVRSESSASAAAGAATVTARTNGDALEIVLRYESGLEAFVAPMEVTVRHVRLAQRAETGAQGAPAMLVSWALSPEKVITLTGDAAMQRVLLRYPDSTGFRGHADEWHEYLIESGNVHLHVERSQLGETAQVVPPSGWMDALPGFVKAARKAHLIEPAPRL